MLSIYMNGYIYIYILSVNWLRTDCSVKKVSIRQGSVYTVSYTVERNGVTINCETIGVVVEQEYHQGGCALREKETR